MQLPTVGLLIIENRKLLLAFSRNKECFYLPGGKIDPGESPASALCREAREELNIELNESHLRYYTHITAGAFGEISGTIMEQDCFFADVKCTPSPSGEIGAIRFFSLPEYEQQPAIAPGVIMIMERLRDDGLID